MGKGRIMKDIASQDGLTLKTIQQAMAAKPSFHAAQAAARLVDYTSLRGDETAADIRKLCAKAKSLNVAGICVFPKHVRSVADYCRSTNIHIATVINFPYGSKSNDGDIATPEGTKADIAKAIANGADEIDIVLDYEDFIEENARVLLNAARQACTEGRAKMKVILEVENGLDQDWEARCEVAVDCGADMLKTSTGKYPEKLSDHEKMRAALVLMRHAKQNNIGFKLSGGLNGDNYAAYISLIEKTMDVDDLNPNIIRLGASSLIDDLHVTLESRGQIKHATKRSPQAY
jgi:deoxyribose-phosphate aldolase